MSQTLSDSLKKNEKVNKYKHYIQKSYVNYVEQLGGKVIPIFMNETVEEMERKLKIINGMILPGGSGDYYKNGQYIFKRLKELYDDNKIIPMWGICLGLEFMIKYVSLDNEVLSIIEVYNKSLPIQFTQLPQQTRMFSTFNKDLIYALTNLNISFNYHTYALSYLKFFQDSHLNQFYKLTSIAFSNKQQAFVNSLEAYNYPFYLTMFHPEKVFTTFPGNLDINYGYQSINISNQFMAYFIQQAYKSSNNLFINQYFKDYSHLYINNHTLIDTNSTSGEIYVYN